MIDMSWRDSIRKEEFQGPKRQYADHRASKFELGLRFKSIDYLLNATKKALEDFMDGLEDQVDTRKMSQLKIALKHIESIQNELDQTDAEMLESAKYSERVDSKHIHNRGAKFRDPLDRGD